MPFTTVVLAKVPTESSGSVSAEDLNEPDDGTVTVMGASLCLKSRLPYASKERLECLDAGGKTAIVSDISFSFPIFKKSAIAPRKNVTVSSYEVVMTFSMLT